VGELTFEGMELTADDGLTLDEAGTAAPDRGSSAQR
jgi:hypothetical protein